MSEKVTFSSDLWEQLLREKKISISHQNTLLEIQVLQENVSTTPPKAPFHSKETLHYIQDVELDLSQTLDREFTDKLFEKEAPTQSTSLFDTMSSSSVEPRISGQKTPHIDTMEMLYYSEEELTAPSTESHDSSNQWEHQDYVSEDKLTGSFETNQEFQSTSQMNSVLSQLSTAEREFFLNQAPKMTSPILMTTQLIQEIDDLVPLEQKQTEVMASYSDIESSEEEETTEASKKKQ